MSMVVGSNTVFEHEGKEYHLQAEDLGSETGAFEVRVYNRGSVVWLKRIPYGDLEARQLPRREHDRELRSMMEKTLLTVRAAIAKGRIG